MVGITAIWSINCNNTICNFQTIHMKPTPQKIEYITIAGKRIKIGPNAVPSTPGLQGKELIEHLQKMQDSGVFSPPEPEKIESFKAQLLEVLEEFWSTNGNDPITLDKFVPWLSWEVTLEKRKEKETKYGKDND